MLFSPLLDFSLIDAITIAPAPSPARAIYRSINDLRGCLPAFDLTDEPHARTHAHAELYDLVQLSLLQSRPRVSVVADPVSYINSFHFVPLVSQQRGGVRSDDIGLCYL